MSFLHDEEDHPGEPVRGLPQALPEGETLLWQGQPGTLAFAIHAFHVRFIIGYFALTTLWRFANMQSTGTDGSEIAAMAGAAALALIVALGLVTGLAWAMARATVYTITSKRIVLRYGVAIRKYVNLPFDQIVSADMRRYGKDKGDVVLSLSATGGVGYLKLWPHVRPMRFLKPQPMLRSLDGVSAVAATLAGAIRAHAPGTTTVRAADATPQVQSPFGAGAPAGI